jgi:hypothetical protein
MQKKKNIFTKEEISTILLILMLHASSRLPTSAVRGSKPDLGMWDFVMDKSGAGAGFLRETSVSPANLHFICSPQSSSLSPEAGTIGQEWPQCQ